MLPVLPPLFIHIGTGNKAIKNNRAEFYNYTCAAISEVILKQ